MIKIKQNYINLNIVLFLSDIMVIYKYGYI